MDAQVHEPYKVRGQPGYISKIREGDVIDPSDAQGGGWQVHWRRAVQVACWKVKDAKNRRSILVSLYKI